MQQPRFHSAALGAGVLAALVGTGVVIAATPGAAQAQVPFRVSRPENGATVRETVEFRIPRTALGDAKYVTLTINDRFRNAIGVPATNADGKIISNKYLRASNANVVLLWDTKALDPTPGLEDSERVIKDGPYTVEVAAFAADGKQVGYQKLSLNVNNTGALQSPAGGVLLTYRFNVGAEERYRQRTEVEYVGERTALPQTTPMGGNSGYRSQGAGQG